MTTTIDLPPELAKFARDCVDEGRYQSIEDVVRWAMRLLQEYEEERRQFEASLDEAVEESEREGWLSIDQVLAEMDLIIEKHSH